MTAPAIERPWGASDAGGWVSSGETLEEVQRRANTFLEVMAAAARRCPWGHPDLRRDEADLLVYLHQMLDPTTGQPSERGGS